MTIQIEHTHLDEAFFETETDPELNSVQDFPLERESFASTPHTIRTIGELNALIVENFARFQRTVAAYEYLSTQPNDDLTQETYLRLVRFIENNNGVEIREPWALVRTIARRLSVDAYRRALTQSRRFFPLYEDSLITDDPNQQDAAILHEYIQHALKLLDVRERNILTRIYMDECNARQVARDLGLSESYVAELKASALNQLRRQLSSNHRQWPA